jgi:hypothetical protein
VDGRVELSDDVTDVLVRAAIADLLERYRIDADRADAIVREEFTRSKDMKKQLAKHTSVSLLERTGAVHSILVESRKRAYYELRRYKDDAARLHYLADRLQANPEQCGALQSEIASGHISTRERLPFTEEFHRRVFELLGEVRTVLDVGGGLHALLFPFSGVGATVERYIVADRDSTAIHAINAFSSACNPRVSGFVWDISGGWQCLLDEAHLNHFDVAFLLKLVPVVARQNPALLEVLLTTPADRWVVTGSTTSMTKFKDISRRERLVISTFINASHRDVMGEFEVGNELGVVLGSRKQGI